MTVTSENVAFHLWRTGTNILDGKSLGSRRELVEHLRDKFNYDDPQLIPLMQEISRPGRSTVTRQSSQPRTQWQLFAMTVNDALQPPATWELANARAAAPLLDQAIPLRDEVEDWINDEKEGA